MNKGGVLTPPLMRSILYLQFYPNQITDRV